MTLNFYYSDSLIFFCYILIKIQIDSRYLSLTAHGSKLNQAEANLIASRVDVTMNLFGANSLECETSSDWVKDWVVMAVQFMQ